MGWRYAAFRTKHEFLKRSGLLKKKFPQSPPFKQYVSLKEWKEKKGNFFFNSKENLAFDKNPSAALKQWFDNYLHGKLLFFSSIVLDIGADYNWTTNPDTGFVYDNQKHWTEISDYSKEAGDIKYVWEKSRFCFLYDLIRYDYHFNHDCAPLVFKEIESWIEHNPINSGPNYVCSQEISMRILNWTFALHYYKNSAYLTEDIFNKVQFAVYWQIHHVYSNINFSRIAVRNNHAITETLTLYLTSLLYPMFPGAVQWKEKGKAWFEEEIAYQVFNDGTYLQFSMNYHRLVIQLLTWAIRLSELNNEKLSDVVKERALKSLRFLDACKDVKSGRLPNCGSNDGALLFKLTDDDYRVYNSQLDDLRLVLSNEVHNLSESFNWYGFTKNVKIVNPEFQELNCFNSGGYYIIHDSYTKTFLRCTAYRNRPSHSDNLHLDIWANGENILRDSGSFKYNASEEILLYFRGCEGHNTVSVAGKSQMMRGPRFIWYYWVKKAKATLTSDNKHFLFQGNINAFKEINPHIIHYREVIKTKGKLLWKISDKIINKANNELTIYWHINPECESRLRIDCVDTLGNKLAPIIEDKWYSGYYGIKEPSKRISFNTFTEGFETIISLDDENTPDTSVF